MSSKLRLVFSITIFFVSFYGFSQVSYWQKKNVNSVVFTPHLAHLEGTNATVFAFQETQFLGALKGVGTAKESTKTLYFPNADGVLIPFHVVETPVMAPALAAKYPQIRSYTGYGLGNSKQKIRFSVSPRGIQSMMVHADHGANTFMQRASNTGGDYVVYRKHDGSVDKDSFLCSTEAKFRQREGSASAKLVEDQALRKFRIAISASGEYTVYHGGTVEGALAAINASITRINEVFETDLGVTLELVENTDLVIFTDPATDPYTTNLNAQAQNTLTNSIGEANYDIGHLFHQGTNNGNAGAIGTVCVDNLKGSAFASGVNPEGDIFDLDFAAHEIGHQFGANHTWSFESEGTLVQVEPASGTTVMGYAGITGINDVASNGDDYFHYFSIVQMAAYLSTAACGETIPRINSTPVITPSGDYVIPKGTAFVLTGSATDPDVDDVLTYAWEQIDNGIVTQSTFGPTRPSGANFRSLKPSTSPQRYFPRLSRVLQGNLTQTNPAKGSAWETVSTVERQLNFALTVRDNAIGGGQVTSDLVGVSVVNGAGPFLVNSQNTEGISYETGSVQEIQWEVANTQNAPVNTQTVDIFLSVDGGLSFPILLVENVPNDGSHSVLLPGIPTTAGRIMVKGHNNIFFAVNAAAFSIVDSEIVLGFESLTHTLCQPNDLVLPFLFTAFDGFNEAISFSALGLPVGLSANFSPVTTTVSNTEVLLTLSSPETVAPGVYPIIVRAEGATVVKEVLLNVTVSESNFLDVPLLLPADGATGISVQQILEWEANPLYTAYDIELAMDMAFTTVIEAATVLFNSYTPVNLSENTTYYWRVKPKNACGEGSFGSPSQFTTVAINCKTVTSTEVPRSISSIGTPRVVSKIMVLDDLPVADVNVSLDITHSFLADLVVTLTSPEGTTVTLISNSCGDLRDINVLFDDEGIAFVCGTTPGISGVLKPLGSLASFNGESTQGEWILEVSDTAPADGGTINSFSLDICVEGNFRPDADNDGVFDDGDDLCLGTPEGTEVNLQGCPVFRLPVDNFLISVQSESCRSSNNGIISIAAAQVLAYTVTITGNGNTVNADFTENYRLENLSAGNYAICILATDGITQYEEVCLEANIREPDPLSVFTALSTENRQLTLSLNGASIYNVGLNGITTQTQTSQITLDLKEGLNTLKVTTDLLCQGSFEESIFISLKPIIYPNSVTNLARIQFNTVVTEEITVRVFTNEGRLLRTEKKVNFGRETVLDVSELPAGMYLITLKGTGINETYKIIKR
ncbi:zinc-dependent metalloprotease family protein [Arenibacter sp. GZD96]|uniref:zinc-dependent metalloprotease n=1 Tax=Aurantibrevibacter litoralis TaxID=3106030 RepID=UPI002AFF4BA4|nr:zinc-dependent metalloprotease family protein [Arenibacter sp. GZD-96]MEA1786502.1 zinc-dependent metalloprotease family protein [Arenibacter sp. GZD-96]